MNPPFLLLIFTLFFVGCSLHSPAFCTLLIILLLMFNINVSWELAQSISALQDLTPDLRYCFIQAQVSTPNSFPFISVCRFSVFFNPDGFALSKTLTVITTKGSCSIAWVWICSPFQEERMKECTGFQIHPDLPKTL